MRFARHLVLPLLLIAALAYAGGANKYHLYLITLGALTVIVGVGLNILLGLSGQVSFGHVGFYAIGAYAVAILMTAGWSFWPALAIAIVLATLIGTGLGLVALRVSGPYLAMVTIAFGFIVEFGAIEWKNVTGGANGIADIPLPRLAGYTLNERSIACLTVLLAAASIHFYRRFAASGWGLALRAVRDSEVAAAALGLNPLAARTLAFALSAAFAGLAGAFFTPLTLFVSPSSFSLFQSILFVLVVTIGGAGRTYGPLIGAIVVIALPELLAGLAEYRVLFFGALLLVVLWIAPGGIAGLIAARFEPRRTRPRPGASGHPIETGAGAPLAVEGLGISFGGLRAVADLGFSAIPGRITSLIGPNGAGKTTAINLICGFYRPDSGSIKVGDIELAGRAAHVSGRSGIARTFQTSQLFGELTVLENLLVAMQRGRPRSVWRPLLDDAALIERAMGWLAMAGFAGDPHARAASLPHIDRRLVEIARALSASPGVLMLDEPAAGLGHQDTERLGALLRRVAQSGIAVVLIEHDMKLVMSISDHVVVMDAGRSIAEGDPDAVRNDPQVIKAYLGEGGFAGRPRPAGWHAGEERALEVSTLDAGYGAGRVLEGVSLAVRTGELVAVLGANGAGKSTLLKALAGLLAPTGGHVLFMGREVTGFAAHRLAGSGLVLVPEGRQVFPELTVGDNIRLGAFARRDLAPAEVEAMFARFPALAARRHARAGLLSGGEQQMLAIARGLIAKPAVLLLDEPSLGLAPALVNELFGVVATLRDEGMTVLLVDQMAALALSVADRAYVIESGRIVHEGIAEAVRDNAALERAYLGVAG